MSLAGELLLPLFFASSGLKTNIAALDTIRYWSGKYLFLYIFHVVFSAFVTRLLFNYHFLQFYHSRRGITLFIIIIATLGKTIPGLLMMKALLREHSWRFAGGFAILMNTRGLVELIALNVALEYASHLRMKYAPLCLIMRFIPSRRPFFFFFFFELSDLIIFQEMH